MYVRVVRYWRPDLRATGPGEWILFDGGKRVAIIREVTVRDVKLIRSVTWSPISEERRLIGYFPDKRLAAEVTWWEWRKAVEKSQG